MEDNDYNRPRRPNADTLTYLKSLPFNEVAAHEEITAYVNQKSGRATTNQDTEAHHYEEEQEVAYPQNLSAALAALDEIKNEIASLAGDEFGSQCIETIARITAPYSSVAARKLLCGINSYLVHLSTHRYGSHVVQTIFQSVLKGKNNLEMSEKEICKILEIDEEEEEEEDLPLMKDILISITEELMPASKELAVHICGSHVLRSLLCILSGVEEELPQHLLSKGGQLEGGGNRRGKLKDKKKKKKKRKNDLAEGNGITNSASFAKYNIVKDPRVEVEDSSIKDCFFSLILELTGIDFKDSDGEASTNKVGDLQKFACNPSAGPLLIVLLRVLTIAFDSSSKGALKSSEANEDISDFRLGITRQLDRFEHNSYAETMTKKLLCWDNSINDCRKQKQSGDIIYGLSGDKCGSIMLETLLRTSNDHFYDEIVSVGQFLESSSFTEYAQHDVSNFVIQTLMTTVRTRTQAESIIKCIEGITSDGYVFESRNRRRGLFWRVCEMAAKFRIGQESLLKYMRKGFATLERKSEDEKEGISPAMVEIIECIPLLISYKAPENEGGKIALDSTGVRTVFHLLRFVPRLCSDILEGILSKYSTTELISICCDGLGSRCIIDGILEGPMSQEPFAKAVKKLANKLANNWTTLSIDRVGQHTTRKIFKKLKSFDDKAVISAELSNTMRILSGNAMGRSIITDCAVREYMEGDDLWRSTVKKAMEKESFLKEITEGEVDAPTKKRKRKRKKKDTEEEDINNTNKVSKVDE